MLPPGHNVYQGEMPMKILPIVLLGVAALTSGAAMSATAKTIPVAAGEGAQQRLQEALIAAHPLPSPSAEPEKKPRISREHRN